jgi:mono/diheme cytochrome c family protein
MRPGVAIALALLLMLGIISCQDDKSIEFARYYSSGRLLYTSHCQNCHGVHGEGLNGLIPPLNDSAFLRKNYSRLPCLVQIGINGKITILKKDFEGQMPATGLAPIEIAQALTYIENSFGNKMGTTTLDTVNRCLTRCN